MLFKSIILIFNALILIAVDITIFLLKPTKGYAMNDDDEYYLTYQKWIRTVGFMMTIFFAIISLYFSIYMKHFLGAFFLCLECIFVIIYTLCKTKVIRIKDDEITVERLFRKDIKTKFSSITKVYYLPNTKMEVKLKNRKHFEVSFNSDNYQRFYNDLLRMGISFKTGRITSTSNKVYLTKYNITIHFPKTMFREYYQSETYFRNSKYLFSARSLDNEEYLEGYYKESGKELEEFIDIVKNDLKINGFEANNVKSENLDGFKFTLIESINKKNKELGRCAYIHHDTDNYLILYTTYKLSDKDKYLNTLNSCILKSNYEDGKSSIVRV